MFLGFTDVIRVEKNSRYGWLSISTHSSTLLEKFLHGAGNTNVHDFSDMRAINTNTKCHSHKENSDFPWAFDQVIKDVILFLFRVCGMKLGKKSVFG